MNLTNTTSVPARVFTSILLGARIGVVVAKATFRIVGARAELEQQDPYPLWGEDQETPLGLLPRDDLPRRDPAFEVILLGAAHARGRGPVERLSVSLAVGDVRRELVVFGDRVWELRDGKRQPSSPVPFTRMPLTWARAFGGRCDVEVDRDAFMPVQDQKNPLGRGFNPEPAIRSLAEYLQAPDGYPRYDETRHLPNVERASAAPVTSWDDEPEPACWATVPIESGVHAARCMPDPSRGGGPDMSPIDAPDSMFHRASPDLVVSRPAAGARVVMEGLSPDADIVSFELPMVRVLADYECGPRVGTLELEPHALVLLPEEDRFFMVWRRPFEFQYPGERSMRLRLMPGWYVSEEGGAP